MSEETKHKNTWFTNTVVKHEGGLLSYAMKIISKMAPSEEVVQESFLKLWKQDFPNHKNEHYPKAWLYRVCRNLAIDFLRKEKRITTEADLEEILSRPCINEALFDASVILQEIKKLTPIQQEVLVLKFCEELTYKEISEVTGLTVNNVGVKIHSALEKLKAIVLKELKEID